ncbi:MAG: hypothetical protein Q8N51_15690 [Gammaproteobacteria bacterium]|nr:hypothetical protein [Gammaproteobacteria bacterium]
MKATSRIVILVAFAAARVPATLAAADTDHPDADPPRRTEVTAIPVIPGPHLMEIHAAIMAAAAITGAKAAPGGELAEARRLEATKLEAEIATLAAMEALESMDADQRAALVRSRVALGELLVQIRPSAGEYGGAR